MLHPVPPVQDFQDSARRIHFQNRQQRLLFQVSTNQHVSAAIDVSFSTAAYQFTGVSANRLRRNSTVSQQSSSQKLEFRQAGSA
ncbi:hypothetical protein OIU85_026696 [Salix viminalis]|uniref:Uncharacterized protein n=1 Tax=Salix viminalis TaxID=40686 RepID=A0A9Q0TP03_SALVM|nr:hypothetical protein OIU85_026696 [Salix viminalis]